MEPTIRTQQTEFSLQGQERNRVFTQCEGKVCILDSTQETERQVEKTASLIVIQLFQSPVGINSCSLGVGNLKHASREQCFLSVNLDG